MEYVLARRARWWLAMVLGVAGWAFPHAEQPALGWSDSAAIQEKGAADIETSGPTAVDIRRTEGLNRMVTQIILENLPDDFVHEDNWGATRQIWDGVRMRWEADGLSTRRRWKTVNHGTWKRYQVTLIDPEQHFQVELFDLRELPEGRVGFQARVDAAARVHARLAEWQYGVQLLGLSALATATIRLEVDCSLALRLDPSRLPPDVLLDPRIVAADLQLVDFRLHRIGNVGGPVVRELGRAARGMLEERLAGRRQRLTDRMQRQIDRRRDELRLSLHELLSSQWGDLAARQLAPPAEHDGDGDDTRGEP